MQVRILIFSHARALPDLRVAAPRVDKYGRRVAETKETDDLKRFYRLDDSDLAAPGPDYARGEGLIESSSEDEPEDDAAVPDADDSEDEGVVTLGASRSKVLDDDDAEIDLDEDNFADLDAQAAAYAKTVGDAEEDEEDESARTRRLAVVNLDWDHVRAVHLLKIFDSVVSASGASSSKSSPRPAHTPASSSSLRRPSRRAPRRGCARPRSSGCCSRLSSSAGAR